LARAFSSASSGTGKRTILTMTLPTKKFLMRGRCGWRHGSQGSAYEQSSRWGWRGLGNRTITVRPRGGLENSGNCPLWPIGRFVAVRETKPRFGSIVAILPVSPSNINKLSPKAFRRRSKNADWGHHRGHKRNHLYAARTLSDVAGVDRPPF
jgi:hypothetical protein